MLVSYEDSQVLAEAMTDRSSIDEAPAQKTPHGPGWQVKRVGRVVVVVVKKNSEEQRTAKEITRLISV